MTSAGRLLDGATQNEGVSLQLTSEQRVRAALNFQKPDYVPLIENYWGDFVARWCERRGLEPLKELPFEDVVDDPRISAYYGVDVAVAIPDESPWPSQKRVLRQDGRYVIYRDGWGRTMRGVPGAEFAARAVGVVVENKSALDHLAFDSAGNVSRYVAYLDHIDRLTSGWPRPYIVTKLGGPFFRPSQLRGFARWLQDVAEDPAFVKALAARVTDHLIAVGLEALRHSELWDMSIAIFDDCASNSGLLVSPVSYEELFLPQIHRMVRVFKEAGVGKVIFHSDGDIRAVLDGLVSVGIDAINPVEPRANMDVVSLRQRYGERLAFMGGLCNSRILPEGSREEVRYHVERLLEAGEDGGLVIGSHSIGSDISLERYEFVMQILAEHGRPLPPHHAV